MRPSFERLMPCKNGWITAKDRAIQIALAVGALAGILSADTSCSLDPVHDGEVKALGPEDPGIPIGQYHRAGQPCTVCHGGEGPANMVFQLAGTIYYQPYNVAMPQNPVGVDQAYVRIKDDDGNNHCFVTNCMGNFFVTPDAFGQKGLKFPFLVSAQKVTGTQSGGVSSMVGHIGRESSCSNCHRDPPYFDSPGHVSLGQPPPNPIPACPPLVEPDPLPVCPEGPL